MVVCFLFHPFPHRFRVDLTKCLKGPKHKIFVAAHKTSGFKMLGFKTSGSKMSETSGLQNVRFTKCQVYKMSGHKTSGLQNVRLQKNIHRYILYLWLVEIRRFCCSHICRQRDGCVLFSILEGFSCHISP
jgi:hypothetical protein